MLQKSKFAIVMVVLIALLAACGIAANGEPGVGIDHIVNNGDGTFTICLTDASNYTVGNFTGPQGPQGLQGLQGEQGIQGVQGEQGSQGIQGFPGVGYYNSMQFALLRWYEAN